MYQVKLEIISAVMNFLCILQDDLSIIFVRGVTSNTYSVERKGRKVFPIDVVIAHSLQHTSACS